MMQAVVIGGGVAGLAAAVGLRRIGWEVRVIERRPGGRPPVRAAHVHRLAVEAQTALTRWLGDEAGARSVAARLGSARAGKLTWRGQQNLTTLAGVEAALAVAAKKAGVDLNFAEAVTSLSVADGKWRVKTASGLDLSPTLLVDASGAHRALFDLLGDAAPSVCVDEVGTPERHVSWQGATVPGDAALIAWEQDDLAGLLQVDDAGQATLTVRGGLDDDYEQGRVMDAMRRAGGADLAALLDAIRFDPKGARYTSVGARLVALDQADLNGWPPFALIGDALIEAPPRYGEGVARALDQVEALCRMLHEEGPTDCAGTLARQARAHWAGYGIALSITISTAA